MSEARALSELCSTSAVYGDGSEVSSYDEDFLSVPPGGTTAVPAIALTSDEVSKLLCDWESRMLRPVAEVQELRDAAGLHQCYTDSKPTRSSKTYMKFLRRLHAAGLVEFRVDLTPTVGCFFVRKRDGSLRVIFDTRIANLDFVAPESTHHLES